MFIEVTVHRIEPSNPKDEERGFLAEFAVEDLEALDRLFENPYASPEIKGYMDEAKFVGDSLWLKTSEKTVQIVKGRLDEKRDEH